MYTNTYKNDVCSPTLTLAHETKPALICSASPLKHTQVESGCCTGGAAVAPVVDGWGVSACCALPQSLSLLQSRADSQAPVSCSSCCPSERNTQNGLTTPWLSHCPQPPANSERKETEGRTEISANNLVTRFFYESYGFRSFSVQCFSGFLRLFYAVSIHKKVLFSCLNTNTNASMSY